MLILHVQIQVKSEHLDAFRTATLANARASREEPGVARFDVCQQEDDSTRFVLWEVYRDATAHAAHRETAHYTAWRNAVAPMMAGPRIGTRYRSVSPEDSGW